MYVFTLYSIHKVRTSFYPRILYKLMNTEQSRIICKIGSTLDFGIKSPFGFTPTLLKLHAGELKY